MNPRPILHREARPRAESPLLGARISRLAAVFAALFTLGALSACRGDGETAESEAPALLRQRTHERLHFETPQRATNVRFASFVAEAVVPPDATWELGPGAAGRLTRWHVRIGDSVEIGQQLAELSNYEASDLLAGVMEARVAAEQAARHLDRQREALDAGVSTRSEVLQAESAKAQADARYTAVRRQYTARAQGAGQGNDGWVSSVEGVVQALHCAPGSVVSPETACIRILDVSQTVLVSHIPEQVVATLPSEVRAQWIPWGSVEGSRNLKIARRSPAIDPLSRTQAFEFASSSGDPLNVIPGQSGRIDLFAPSANNWVVVPNTALTRYQGEDVVFLRDPDSGDAIPTAIPVTVIRRDTQSTVVESEILSENSPIVTRGVFLLRGLIEDGSEHAH